jgi:hypothetical protein
VPLQGVLAAKPGRQTNADKGRCYAAHALQ